MEFGGLVTFTTLKSTYSPHITYDAFEHLTRGTSLLIYPLARFLRIFLQNAHGRHCNKEAGKVHTRKMYSDPFEQLY